MPSSRPSSFNGSVYYSLTNTPSAAFQQDPMDAHPETVDHAQDTVDSAPAPHYDKEKAPVLHQGDAKNPHKPEPIRIVRPGSDTSSEAASTVSRARSVGTFGRGAGASGPITPIGQNATLHNRASTAESVLSEEVLAKIVRTEGKEAKRMSKVIKNEGKAETKYLKAAMKELDQIQKVQRKAANDEAHAQTAQRKAVKTEHKLHMAYLAAKAKFEGAAADLQAKTLALEATREHAMTQTELLQHKTQEVEQLRIQKATDDREREAKLQILAANRKR